METHNAHTTWLQYRDTELAKALPVLETHGFQLDSEQPHIQGERFLMQAVTTAAGKKLILLGTHTNDNLRVVIKISSDPAGIQEIEHERLLRAKLPHIIFSRETFHAPQEIAHIRSGDMVISIQEFITQTSTFLERPTGEQFMFALRALKAQEGTHAATSSHIAQIRAFFAQFQAQDYLTAFAGFIESIRQSSSDIPKLHALLTTTYTELSKHSERIQQYCGFLSHTDFVPHNIRINDDTIYLLDFSALRFGNKHEGWARFLNFMTLYNPELERALLTYIQDNRAPEEHESLRLMRLYRLGEILCYYTRTLHRSDGDLNKLNYSRIQFWSEVLDHTLSGTPLPEEIRNSYIKTRDRLRSDEEKKRQKGLH